MEMALVKALLESDVAGQSRQDLAKNLGVDLEDLNAVEKAYNEEAEDSEAWKALVLERQTQPLAIGQTWDSLEEKATQRLLELVAEGAVKSVGDMLAIARIANNAHRRGSFVTAQSGGNTGTGVLAGVGINGQPILPGAAAGTMNLSLTFTAAESAKPRLNPEAEMVTAEEARESINTTYEVIDDPQEIRAIADGDVDSAVEFEGDSL